MRAQQSKLEIRLVGERWRVLTVVSPGLTPVSVKQFVRQSDVVVWAVPADCIVRTKVDERDARQRGEVFLIQVLR